MLSGDGNEEPRGPERSGEEALRGERVTRGAGGG